MRKLFLLHIAKILLPIIGRTRVAIDLMIGIGAYGLFCGRLNTLAPPKFAMGFGTGPILSFFISDGGILFLRYLTHIIVLSFLQFEDRVAIKRCYIRNPSEAMV